MPFIESEYCLAIALTEVDETSNIISYTPDGAHILTPSPVNSQTLTLLSLLYETVDDYFNCFDLISDCSNSPYTIIPSSLSNQTYILGTP